jgi:hypothetical protein
MLMPIFPKTGKGGILLQKQARYSLPDTDMNAHFIKSYPGHGSCVMKRN